MSGRCRPHLAAAPTLAPVAPTPSPAAMVPAAVTRPADSAEGPAVKDGSYKLTGIMRGPDGSVAVINGEIVKVGETVGDAKVIKINTNSVLIDDGGKKITLRM
jgi:MSHA biogenesis protein MshK